MAASFRRPPPDETVLIPDPLISEGEVVPVGTAPTSPNGTRIPPRRRGRTPKRSPSMPSSRIDVMFVIPRMPSDPNEHPAVWPVRAGFTSAADAKTYKRRFGLPPHWTTFLIRAAAAVSYVVVETTDLVRQRARQEIAQRLASLISPGST